MKKKPIWIFHHDELMVDKNNPHPYLYSVWCGTLGLWLGLPLMLWEEVLAPAIGGIALVILTLMAAAINGLLGRSFAIKSEKPKT